MRKLLFVAVGTLALAICPPAVAATKTVRIKSTGFSPQTVTIDVGDSVKWVNDDTVNRQVVADNGFFASPILRPGKSYTKTFTAAGTYRYRDTFKSSQRGTVVVKGAPPSVSIGLAQPIVVYGTQMRLSGVISNQRAGETVTIFYRPYPQTSMVQLATVITTTGGAWDYLVTPEILTTYQAKWRSASSVEVTTAVRPRVGFGRTADGFFLVKVTADRPFARKAVFLQRLSRFGQWVNVKKILLGSASSRRFKALLPRGVSRLRIAMSVNQAGAGYLGSFSRTLAFRRR
jgi:plastocyanin